MNYVKHLQIFDIDAFQIPCVTGSGAPTTATEGAVGMFYMDTDNGKVYKCTSADADGYTWEKLPSADDLSSLPEVAAADNGKFLRVVNGAWAAASVDAAETKSF